MTLPSYSPFVQAAPELVPVERPPPEPPPDDESAHVALDNNNLEPLSSQPIVATIADDHSAALLCDVDDSSVDGPVASTEDNVPSGGDSTTSVDELGTATSVSSSESELRAAIPAMVKLLRSDEGVGIATTTRWSGNVTSDIEVYQQDLPWTSEDDTYKALDSEICTPGSIMDPTRGISPSDIRDFPDFEFLTLDDPPRQENVSDSILDRLAEADNDVIVPLYCVARVVNFPLDTSTVVCKADASDSTNNESIMPDTGANCCLTDNIKMLVDVVKLDVPIKVGLALNESDGKTTESLCTHKGYYPMPLSDGSIHYQAFFFNAHASDTIMSPEAVIHSNPKFKRWVQSGERGLNGPGSLSFISHSGETLLELPLTKRNGLYYCSKEVFLPDSNPIRANHVSIDETIRQRIFQNNDFADYDLEFVQGDNIADEIDFSDLDCELFPFDEVCRDAGYNARRAKSERKDRTFAPKPVSPKHQLQFELWAARMGHCSESQLKVLPAHVDGTPNQFSGHPMRHIDHLEAAWIRKQPVGKAPEKAEHCKDRFFLDFGFMRSSNIDYTRPNPTKDRIVKSYDGYSSYLAVVDEASRKVWIFLRQSKEPPLELMSIFLKTNGSERGGVLRCDQGGELARSKEFCSEMLKRHNYKVEPTGGDSPEQNAGVEKWNDSLAVTTRALLYGAALPATYWSAALVHAAYLHNRRVHRVTKKTPFEAWTGRKPNLRRLKMFGSRVCVKQTGKRRAKLDKHHFTGIFLGYSATDQNIKYMDLDTGIEKTTHHAVFDEAWYLQSSRPPAAQLLYDLGLVEVDDSEENESSTAAPLPPASYPPDITRSKCPEKSINGAIQLPLPFRLGPTPNSVGARAAKTSHLDPYADTVLATKSPDGTAVSNYGISRRDLAQVYISQHPYNASFEEQVNLKRFLNDNNPSAGMRFKIINDRLILETIDKSTPCARIPRWRSRLKGAWLIKVGDVFIHSLADVHKAFEDLVVAKEESTTLLFSHPEIKHGLTNEGIPQVSIDQLNPRLTVGEFIEDKLPLLPAKPSNTIKKVLSGDVLQYVTAVTMAKKLTRGKLLQADDWDDWEKSEWKQLDQYELQNMFGDPTEVDSDGAVFNLVWTYVVKELDKRKKARMTCDGSTRGGKVRVLDHTYANCVDQTSSRLFYAAAAAENLVIYGADVSNAFGEAPPPKQGFFIKPDKAFREWWTKCKGRPPIPKGHVIPVLAAMQGHPEAPRLWEKHADAILRSCGLTPTIHEPCLYSGLINGERVILMRQVDDFAIAASSERTCNILFDMIDEQLTIPLKRLGLINMFNGLDIQQTRDWIKVSCATYLTKISERHLKNWMSNENVAGARLTPLPSRDSFMKTFLAAKGNPDPKVQAALAKKWGFSYRSGIGELIYALVTCRPDLSYAVTRCSQYSACPHEIHYHGVKHLLKYAYNTKDDGIYFWRATPNMDLPAVDPPSTKSNEHDLLMDGRPKHDATDLHAYVDADWAGCPQTRRSFTGTVLCLSGGPVAYKCKLEPTVALSSTEGEYMGAVQCGRMILFVRSVMWDLGIPQVAASLIYEDNDAATKMANARKPTPRTRHMDIKYHALCEWVEQDLMTLERIDTSQNLADHFTKSLGATLFQRHTDYIMGRVPPQYSSCFQRIYGLIKERSTSSASPTSYNLPKHFSSRPAAAAAAKLCASWDLIVSHLY